MNIAMSTQEIRFWRITGAEPLTLPVDGSVPDRRATAAVRLGDLKRSQSSITEMSNVLAPVRPPVDSMDSRARCDAV